MDQNDYRPDGYSDHSAQPSDASEPSTQASTEPVSAGTSQSPSGYSWIPNPTPEPSGDSQPTQTPAEPQPAKDSGAYPGKPDDGPVPGTYGSYSGTPYRTPNGQRPGPYQHYQQQPPVRPLSTGSSALAAISMVCGVCSFLFMMSGGFLFFGSLGILFALLSRGAGALSGSAKAGLAGSIAGILIGIVVTVFLFSSLMKADILQNYLNQMEQYYNFSIDSIDQNFPDDLGDIL